jgi:hypothetical protein
VFSNSAALSTQIITGHLVGAHKEDAAYKRVLTTLKVSLPITIGLSVINWLASPYTLRLFTSNEHIIQIVKGDLKLYNGAIYKEKSNAHTFTMKFVPNNETIFLKGIGFNSRALFGVLKSDFVLTIKSQRFLNEKLLLTLNPKEHVIVKEQYQDINFVMIQHPIKMERNVQYEISLTRTNNDTLINDDDNNYNSVQQIGKKTYYQNDLYSSVFDFQNEQFVLSNDMKQCNIYTHLIYIKI